MLEEVDKFQIIESMLREKLNYVKCPLCDFYIVDDGKWDNRHIPIVKIDSNGCIEAGYYCGYEEREVIVYRDCSSSTGSTGTRIMEELRFRRKVNRFREIESMLREKLNYVKCPLCDFYIVDDGKWDNRHIPIVKIDSNGCIEAGYYCGYEEREVIVYRDCSSSTGSTGTRIMESTGTRIMEE